MDTRKKFLFPLNIQLFADDGNNGSEGGNENGQEQKTYTEEEFKKLKASFDSTASELAKMKKEQKAKMSEEEKRLKEQEEKDLRLKELELKVLTSDITNELMTSGLEKDSISKIVEAIKGGDLVEMSKVISKEITILCEKVKKEAQSEFQRNGTIPPAGEGKQTDTFIKSLIESKSKNSSKNAREYYLKK